MIKTLMKAAGLTAAIAASSGVLVAAPASAHAAPAKVQPAVTRECPSGDVDVHFSSGPDNCYFGTLQIIQVALCHVTWVDTGNNWAAVWWGYTWTGGNYQPGMPPWTTFAPGGEFCVQQLAINT